MNRTAYFIVLLICVLVAGCGGKVTTTAAEPQFVALSEQPLSPADAELYASLDMQNPAAANRIALAIAIEGLDPANLPVPPSQPPQTYQVGDTRTFWTHNSDTLEFIRITARLMAVSAHAYFWQDEASQALNGKGEPATAEDWTAVAESFDVSYERVRAVFGNEPSPGLDGDARLWIVNSDTLGMRGGYFGQTDMFPAMVEAHSNQGEFFYMSNTWSTGIASDYYMEVLAHEFQHMIRKAADPNEEGWLNEGLSMLAQQVAGMRGDNYVGDYLLRPDQSLWYWGGKAEDYGQSFLFVEYLYEQLGPDFIRAVAADPRNGLASIDGMLTQFDSPRTADELYLDAVTAAYLNNPALASGQYAFQEFVPPAIAPRYRFESLPAVFEGTVQQYGGMDIITFAGKGEAVLTFFGDQTVDLIPTRAHSGERFWWSNRHDSTFGTLTREVDLTGTAAATLQYWTWFDIEEDWDYAYLLASTDGGLTWTLVPSTSSRETNPVDQNLGLGITGKSGGGTDAIWVRETADLSAFAGQRILLRFAMQNDIAVNEFGFAVDDLSIPEIGWQDDCESGSDWVPEGFVLSHNRVPQAWGLRAVERLADGGVNVHDLTVRDGTAKLAINFDELEQLVVLVVGQTRYTTIPASYRVVIDP